MKKNEKGSLAVFYSERIRRISEAGRDKYRAPRLVNSDGGGVASPGTPGYGKRSSHNFHLPREELIGRWRAV